MSFMINTTINGKAVSASAEASTSLLEFLRDTLEMKGSKLWPLELSRKALS